jgi:glycosyltransferase involved in cell wall biosynthesis
MRIVFVSHYATPHIGGIETVVQRLRRRLLERGHEVVHVASTASHYPLDDYPVDRGVIRIPALNVLEERLGVPYPIFSPRLHSVLARELASADVVHAHGLLYMSSVWALRYAKLRYRSGGPVRVLTEHVGHVPYDSAALNKIESAAIATVGRAAVRAAESVVVLNRQVAAEVGALGARGRVLHIPNGIDTTLFRPPHSGEREALRAELGWDDQPRVLFVGRLVAKKGLDTALAAAAAAAGKFELVVAGPGPLQPAPAPGLSVLGPVPAERVAQLYRAADALLLPSRGEGFPVAVQEAMASALPVVMTNDPSYARYLNGAGRGVLLVPPAPEAIARTLEQLVGDPDARIAAGLEGLAHARAAFTWEQAADRHEQLYETLLAARELPDDARELELQAAVYGAQATTASERGAIP